MKRSLRRVHLTSVVAALAAACAQSNGDIKRVQPNVVRKADLLGGQWFFRNVVTYTPHNTEFTFPGMTGALEKLVWEVQEGHLVGYRAYPYTPGAEGNVDPRSRVSGTTATFCNSQGECSGGQTYFGAPLVAYPIESHFDVQRGFNPATGEQTNVISENTTDRPWNRREFIRVDWAANLLNASSGVGYTASIQNPSGSAPNASWIQPNEPGSDPDDWPNFEYTKNARGRDELTYFDFTGRYVVNPDQIVVEDYGSVPMCLLARGIYDCSSSEIKIRTSVWKVDVVMTRDYEPLVYPNELMSLFGLYRTERLNYDRKFGYNDSAVIRIGDRFRTWEHYFYRDDLGQPDPAQPIPLAQRTPKPIVYYFPPPLKMGGQQRYDEFWAVANQFERNFDRAFRRATAAAQGKRVEEVPQAFYLCNNPVKAGDPPACGGEGFSPRLGDLRYSFLNTVAEPVSNGLLGYGPHSQDPETGQIISALPNVYTWSIDSIAREVTDWVLLLEGERSINEHISGAAVRDFIQSHPTYTIAKVKSQIATVQAELQGTPQRSEQTKGVWERPSERLTTLVNTLKASGLPARTGDALRAAAAQLQTKPDLESALLDNPELQYDVANLLPPVVQQRGRSDPAFLRAAKRGVLTNLNATANYERQRLALLNTHGISLSEFYDHTLVGLANEKVGARRARIAALRQPLAQCALSAQCGANASCVSVPVDLRQLLGERRCKMNACNDVQGCTEREAKRLADDELTQEIRQQVWLATSLHEAGHSVNLRHNFQGSFDAINYQDGYWQSRKESITVMQGGVAKLPRTPGDLKNALEGTENQRWDRMYDRQYSSIMDYGGKQFGDWFGLGKYDEAAIVFAYSGSSEPEFALEWAPAGTGAASPGYVEVFNAGRRESRTFPGSDGALMTISGAGVDLPLVNATHTNPNVRNYTERFHYSTVPLHFGEGADLNTVIADGVSKLGQRRLVRYAEVRRDEQRVAAVLRSDPSLIEDPDRAAGALGTSLLRVPYMVCSDESVNGPIQSCHMFDAGPDYYEQVRTKLESYWAYYFDSHFRRDAAFFSGRRAVSRAFDTFTFTANNYKHWVYELYRAASPSQEQGTRYRLDPILQDSWTMSVLDGLNQHLNVMSVPPYGLFMRRTLRSGPRWDVVNSGDDFDSLTPGGRERVQDYYVDRFGAEDFVEVPRGLGRRMYSRYDFKSGFGFWNRMLEAGHYNDQLGAMFAAVDTGLELQGVDRTADQNRYNIGYSLVFRKEMADTFGALWSSHEDKVRPLLYRAYDERGQLTQLPKLAWRVYANGADLFQGFNYPAAQWKECAGNQTPPGCFGRDQHAAPANIQLTWTSRIYALYLGMAAFRANYDLDYAKANQVFKLGGAEDFTVAPGYHTVEVPDVVSGGRYLAVEKDGASADSTPAVRMINTANIYLAMVKDPARCPIDDSLIVLGYSCMDAAQANNPALVEERRRYWSEVYQDGTRDLDLMRGFYSLYGRAF